MDDGWPGDKKLDKVNKVKCYNALRSKHVKLLILRY